MTWYQYSTHLFFNFILRYETISLQVDTKSLCKMRSANKMDVHHLGTVTRHFDGSETRTHPVPEGESRDYSDQNDPLPPQDHQLFHLFFKVCEVQASQNDVRDAAKGAVATVSSSSFY